LRQYFAVHPIIVVNETPLSNILNNPSATWRVSLWGIKLSPMDITYEKRKAIKSQILPDFTAEWLELQSTGPPDLSSVWTMYFDGSKRVQGAGAWYVSNVSITFDAPCLFLHHLPIVSLHFVALLCIFRN
jgi:hypothetical protein